jgi:protein-tyrosine phosphatase
MKYTLMCGLLGAVLICCGWSLGWWGVLPVWFALGFFALAAGHAGLGPRVFGKGADGKIPLWSKALHLPFLTYTGIVQFAAVVVRKENAWDRVSDRLLIGRRLAVTEVPADIVNYVDLTAEMEDVREIRERHGYVCFPILDGSVPSGDDLKKAIANLADGVTYVHCAQGHGRTALFALALLSARGEIRDVTQGLDLLKTVRPGVRLNSAQRKFIKAYLEENSEQSSPADRATPAA